MRLSMQELERFINDLNEEEYYDEKEGVWLFRNGGQCSICTDSAIRIARRFDGIVLGYYSINNPDAKIGLPMIEGHDFTLISSRWLVDYWAWNIALLVPKPIFDLLDPEDEGLVVRYYSSSICWQTVEIN